VLSGDPLANLPMSFDGIVARDARVFADAAERDVPIVMVLGGGYSDDAWLAQYRSLRHLIRTYGISGPDSPHPPRRPTTKEKLYTE
jgi:acetoin utilization deacetylase AcuC-like enzyme